MCDKVMLRNWIEDVFDDWRFVMIVIDSGTWQLVSSESGFSNLKSDWERLFQQNARHSPFLAWGWVSAWLRHLAGPHELRIACWRDAHGELQFILPLINKSCSRNLAHEDLALVCSYGAECSDHLGCLRAPAYDREIAEISTIAISQYFHKCNRIRLGFLDNAGEYPSKLKSAMQANGRVARLKNDACCPTVRLSNSWDEYLQRLSRNFRSQIRRHYKRISEHKHLNFRSVSESGAESFTRDLIRLNRARISEKGEVSSLENKSFRNFLAEAVPYMASNGIAWMDIVEENGNTLGSALNFLHGDSVYYYMGGFDENAKNLRPGTSLFVLVIKRSIDEGYACYNFLRGGEAYKYRWGAKDVVTDRVDIYPRGFPVGFLFWSIDGVRISTRSLIRRLRSLRHRQV